MEQQDVDYRQYFDLESYLFSTVRHNFIRQGYLTAFDFFCIVIWKAERAKSKIAKKLLKKGKEKNLETLDDIVRKLTEDLAQQKNAKDRLKCLWNWDFYNLPTATAILSVLYPDDFTVYDARVCDELNDFHDLKNLSKFENLWDRYEKFKCKVEESSPPSLSLRDKDRYLWGKSFYNQLKNDIEQRFHLST